MAETINFSWTRYWYPRGVRPTLVDDYLVLPNAKQHWFSPGQTTTLKTLPELAEVPCLILLGDPGTGKSNEISTEAARLGTTLVEGFVVKRLDLKLRTESLIEKQVFRSEEFIGWTEGRHALALFFDSMDECWRRVPELGPVIIAELEPHLKKKLPPLYLRLGCRAAEWREEIEGDLRRLFGDTKESEKVQVWELAPLAEENVRVAAKTCGLEDVFLNEVKEREVNAFAAHPITLRMLLATAQEGGPLSRDRAEIYQKGCELLCRDSHHDEKRPPRLSSTLPQRLICASYLAAAGVLSNRYLLFGATERRPDDESGTIAAQDVLGQRTLVAGADFEITREIFVETLQTGLFDAQSGDLFSWRHQSYAEYLAASYLHLRQIPAEEIVQSLCDTSSGRALLWPQVEETACWLATLAPEVFEQLVGTNAEVFVRCDPARLGPQQRAQIVAGYLEQIRGHEAQGSETNRLRRLAHPGIVQQLAPCLTDKAEDIYVRDLAIDITRACELRELADVLIVIAFMTGEPPRLRHAAAVALRDWADADIRSKVRAQLTPEVLDSDDVRGCILAILWPGSLTEEELVPLLVRPARDNYLGSYQLFLSGHFREHLQETNLVPLVRWVRDSGVSSKDRDHGHYEGAGSAVLLAAYHAIATPEVCAEFLLAFHACAKNHRRLFKCDGRDIAGEQALRKILWREIVAGESPVRSLVVTASMREAGLVVEDDFDWIIEEALAAAPRECSRWIELAFWVFRPLLRPEQIDRLRPFAKADAAVADRLLLYTTSQLFEKNGEPNWQKGHHYGEEQRLAERAKRKPLKQRVDEALSGYEKTQKPNFIWGLVHLLNCMMREFDEENFPNSGEVAWKHLDDEQWARIRALAPGFLTSVTVNLDEVYDKEQYYWSYVAGVGFLLDLVEVGSPWPAAQSEAFWESWTPVIIHYQERLYHVEEAAWQELLKLAFHRAKMVFVEAVRRWLAEREERSLHEERFELLPIGTDPEFEEVFLANALATNRKSARDFDFFSFLLRHQSRRTETMLVSWLPQESVESNDNGSFAEALLVCGQPALYARPALDHLLQDNAWGRKVFLHLATPGGVRSNWLDVVDAERLVRLWEWLDREFPGDPFEKGGGTVTAIDEIGMFRNQLITYIQKRGTADTVDALRGLLLRHPEYKWLGRVIAQTREIVRRESWKPPMAWAVIAYLSRKGRPPLCNDADLADALKASLAHYQKMLKGPNPPTELWNESAGPVKDWTPKDEENLSDCLARHIARDLKHHKVTVARESELRQGTPSSPGDEPDLCVTAPSASGDEGTLKVVIEVKCSWNRETVTGMEQQLLNRYLRGLSCGIYVVGHFNCHAWLDTDSRKKQIFSGYPLHAVTAMLEGERARLLELTSKRLDLVVLDTSV